MLTQKIGFREVFMSVYKLTICWLLLSLTGCLSIGRKINIEPSDVMRQVEAGSGHWCVLADPTNHLVRGIAVRICSEDVIVLYNNKYLLVNSSNKKEKILEPSGYLTRLSEIVYEGRYLTADGSLVPSRLFQNCRKVKVEGTQSSMDVFGAWLNVDKIFNDCPAIDFLLVDDLANGLLFTRDQREVFGHVSSRYPFILDLVVKDTVSSYEEIYGKLTQ
jgi:hypothetical protein